MDSPTPDGRLAALWNGEGKPHLGQRGYASHVGCCHGSSRRGPHTQALSCAGRVSWSYIQHSPGFVACVVLYHLRQASAEGHRLILCSGQWQGPHPPV